MIYSSAFGPFDPLHPAPIKGLFAEILIVDAVEIEAPLASVWQVMTDFERYPEWNPLNRFFKLDGKAQANETVTFGPHWGPYSLSEDALLPKASFTQKETITVWEENHCLSYAVVSKVFNAERSQVVSSLANGNTRYQTFERVCGLFCPIVKLAYRNKILRGFTANGLALKKRSEQMI